MKLSHNSIVDLFQLVISQKKIDINGKMINPKKIGPKEKDDKIDLNSLFPTFNS